MRGRSNPPRRARHRCRVVSAKGCVEKLGSLVDHETFIAARRGGQQHLGINPRTVVVRTVAITHRLMHERQVQPAKAGSSPPPAVAG